MSHFGGVGRRVAFWRKIGTVRVVKMKCDR